MAEDADRDRRNQAPRPRNEPTEPKEVSGDGGSRSGQRTDQTTQTRQGPEKVGRTETPRTGATTGTGASTKSNAETRGGPRNAADESGMPKRSGPGRTEDR